MHVFYVHACFLNDGGPNIHIFPEVTDLEYDSFNGRFVVSLARDISIRILYPYSHNYTLTYSNVRLSKIKHEQVLEGEMLHDLLPDHLVSKYCASAVMTVIYLFFPVTRLARVSLKGGNVTLHEQQRKHLGSNFVCTASLRRQVPKFSSWFKRLSRQTTFQRMNSPKKHLKS